MAYSGKRPSSNYSSRNHTQTQSGNRSSSRSNRRFDDRPKFGSDRDLLRILQSIDGNSYGAYKRTIGHWDYGNYQVVIDRVQADPYAPPSSVRIITTPQAMGLPAEVLQTRDQRLAVGDFLNRVFARNLQRLSGKNSHPSALSIARTTPEILERSAVQVSPNQVELRIQVRLPARGRTIMGREAEEIFDEELPDVVADTLDFSAPGQAGSAAGREPTTGASTTVELDQNQPMAQDETNSTPAPPLANLTNEYLANLIRHVHTLEDHRELQRQVAESGWVAFVANQSILARRSGISELPLEEALPFQAPPTLQQTVTLPHAGEVSGMAIPRGITLIVGGGYHGKSTMLSALQRGVYPHVPGDGRELVATLPGAVKIRAADGRPVEKVDVSAFINHLPTGTNTRRFSTQNASGSTSQAAAIVEAIEVGTPALLIDEDTSATNLMIRDERMRQLVAAEQEPITPLVDRIRALFEQLAVSTVMVMGGSGDYLDVADLVLQMDSYRCLDVTEQARQVARDYPRTRGDQPEFPAPAERCPLRQRKTSNKPKTKATGTAKIDLDRQTVDVSDVEQIVDPGQTEAIAWAMRGLLEQLADARTPLTALLDDLEQRLEEGGLDYLTRFGERPSPAFLVRPRRVDVAAAVNRYRALTIA